MSIAASNGQDGFLGRAGGGGAGGAVGRIRLNAATMCQIVGPSSPAATSNGTSGCP
jgi:hypothetical protein